RRRTANSGNACVRRGREWSGSCRGYATWTNTEAERRHVLIGRTTMSDAPHLSAVTVRIAGEEHALRASADAEYTRSCARFVDERIREIREKSGLVETHRAAILAALSITDQLFRVRE